jgi:N-acetylglucosamine malate deacetylase 1
LPDQRRKSVLVIAPHPDDETFGCGGTMRMLAESGIAVDVAFMTRGELGLEAGATGARQQEVARQRTQEAKAACEVLGARELFFLDGADTCLAEQPHLAQSLAGLFANEAYQRVFCPWAHDAHPDHIATFGLLKRAVRGHPAPDHYWFYEVWKPLAANTFVPIDNTVEAKRRAIEQYQSQLALCNYEGGVLGLAAYRSLFCPASRYAEAFLVCDRNEFLQLS